jgi:hypothetical protein
MFFLTNGRQIIDDSCGFVIEFSKLFRKNNETVTFTKYDKTVSNKNLKA